MMSRKKLRLGVILNTYNQPQALDVILESLLHQTVVPAVISIADDGSDQRTFVVIEKWVKTLVHPALIDHCWHEDDGFRRSLILNTAVSRTDADYLVFLDGDCVPCRQFIEDHVKLAEEGYFVQGRRSFIVEKRVDDFLAKRTDIMRLRFTGGLQGGMKSIRTPLAVIIKNKKRRGIIGCNLGIWKSDFVKVNGFDEAFKGWGHEDAELCYRLYNNGITRKFVYGRAYVYHLNHPQQSREREMENKKILEQCIAERRLRCVRGLADRMFSE